MKILISGAGIAGPSAAFWLERSGHEVTIVEVAPALREGGYIVDFWGIGYDIVERMGLLPEVLANGYQVKEVRYVNSDGERAGGFSTAAIEDATGGRFTSIKRSDLSRIIFEALNGRVETLFGNSIVSIDEDGESVEVEFATGPHRKFDLVIGCDGLHSAVRRL